MTENESQIVEYPFTIFFSFSHETSITPSYLPILLIRQSKNSFRDENISEYSYTIADFCGEEQFTVTSENICARKQISITRDWILAGDGIIRGFPNGFYLARSCPIGSLILVNTSRKDHNGRHHMRGCAKGTYVPSQRIKWHHDVAFEIPRTGEAYC